MINILILAAGSSSRLGQPKQLQSFKGKLLINHVIKQATGSSAENILVVLGAFYDKILEEIESNHINVFNNKEWAKGMGSSIALGLKALENHYPGQEAVIILSCDQPFITSKHIDQLITAFNQGNKVVASRYKNAVGIPALFDRSYFDQLYQLSGDRGAKTIIEQAGKKSILFKGGEIDIDTPQDLKHLT